MPKKNMKAPPAATRPRAVLKTEDLNTLYRGMLLVRMLDEKLTLLQRQGRIGFYGTCTGEEAAVIGSAYALEAGDWIFPALRQGGAALMRGYSLRAYMGQVFGNAADILKGRQMPVHFSDRNVHQVSWSSCIGTQLPQAVGTAHAARIRGERTVVMAYLGDGATSEADFHVAMNFAGVWKAPIVFLCQNNQWAISVPLSRQTTSENLAVKASAYGFEGVSVDGNNVLSVFDAAKTAVDKARRGGGPTFIEAITYRVNAHSTSDDPSRYRDESVTEQWRQKDPILRFRAALKELGLWDEALESSRAESINREINEALVGVEGLPGPHPESLFDDVYADPPAHLQAQLAELVRLKRNGD